MRHSPFRIDALRRLPRRFAVAPVRWPPKSPGGVRWRHSRGVSQRHPFGRNRQVCVLGDRARDFCAKGASASGGDFGVPQHRHAERSGAPAPRSRSIFGRRSDWPSGHKTQPRCPSFFRSLIRFFTSFRTTFLFSFAVAPVWWPPKSPGGVRWRHSRGVWQHYPFGRNRRVCVLGDPQHRHAERSGAPAPRSRSIFGRRSDWPFGHRTQPRCPSLIRSLIRFFTSFRMTFLFSFAVASVR